MNRTTLKSVLFSTIVLFFAVGAQAKSLDVLEKQNQEFIEQFFDTLMTLDMDQIAAKLDEEVVFKGMRKPVHGKDNFYKYWKMMIKGVVKQEIKLHRSHAYGDVVVTERTGTVYGKEPGDQMTINLASVFVVKNGKILEWSEYRMPKTKML